MLASRFPPARRLLIAAHRWRNRDNPLMRSHPLDVRYGVDTSGYTPSSLLATAGGVGGTAYASCQPSSLRRALAQLPDVTGRAFVDLGCGKGRALVLASEHPFREILGVELDAELAAVAARNAAVIAKGFPDRTPIRVLVADATSFDFPAGDLVVFLYNPFGEELVARAIANVERAMADEPREVHVVYDNPVHETAVDSFRGLRRCFDEEVPLDPSEVGYSPWTEFRVVIWRGSSRD